MEYTQQYLKKFNSMIPWEARGVMNKELPSLVEWTGDPNAVAEILYEFTDPLFALFVMRDTCDYWLADCDGTKWVADCYRSEWQAEATTATEYADDVPLVWTARDEEHGGVWCAAPQEGEWQAAACDTVWTADSENFWTADAACVNWKADAYGAVWNAAPQGTRWTVFEPNPRGD